VALGYSKSAIDFWIKFQPACRQAGLPAGGQAGSFFILIFYSILIEVNFTILLHLWVLF